MKRVLVYKRFERFWHWAQAMLIILLVITGMDIHYPRFRLFDFKQAHDLHHLFAWSLVILIAFAIFWHFTTGEWKQYMPTPKYLGAMVKYYISGIFRNAPHPVRKTVLNKLNPLQRLAYLGLKILIIPVMVTTGMMLIYYNDLVAAGWPVTMGVLATIHTIGAFALVVFVIGHIYLASTGETLFANTKAMITGYEELEDDEAESKTQPPTTQPAPGK